jgi:hypothetical protein
MRKSRSGKGVRGNAGALVVAFVSAVALVALSTQASRAQECLLEFREQTSGLAVTDGASLCQTATDKLCTFNLQVCVNTEGCTPVDLKHKNIRASGHCGPVGKVHAKANGTTSLCGAFAGVKVRLKKHGQKAGKCVIHAKAGTDKDTLTLNCQPSSSPCAATTTTTTTPGATTTTTIGGGQASVALGSAANFVVLAGSTVTNTGATTVTGDLGVSPGTAVTGFPPGVVNGMTHAGDPAAAQAQIDLTTAFNDAAGRSVGAVTVAGNLGGQTLTPGLYKSTSSLEISSGDLTLDAQGDANAVFIFQMASTLTTTAGRQVILSGGAKAANVFWQVGSSATLGTTSVFKGNILADQSITLNTGATLDGRALARIAAVALATNTITKPAP